MHHVVVEEVMSAVVSSTVSTLFPSATLALGWLVSPLTWIHRPCIVRTLFIHACGRPSEYLVFLLLCTATAVTRLVLLALRTNSSILTYKPDIEIRLA